MNMKQAAPFLALTLAACANQAAPVASDIIPPDAKYMQPLAPPVAPVEGMKMDDKSRAHLATLRNQCGDYRSTATGLQKWVLVVTGKPEKK